jgi:Protein of unknown function (DUF2842)
MMKLRTRKAIGTAVTLLWITLYSLVMMAVGAILIVGRGVALELPFYILAGLGWVPVEMLIIRWMSKPDPEDVA